MYRLGSDLAHVHYHVSDIKENEVVEIPESEIVGMDIARFRMNLSKVSKDIGMVFVTRFDSHKGILKVRRIS
jgi:hypothetical protein